MRRIGAENLDQRLGIAGPTDEVKELADTIDGLLERLEGSFAAQRRFVANASHELRTPLVPGSPALLARMVGNIVDNAVTHKPLPARGGPCTSRSRSSR